MPVVINVGGMMFRRFHEHHKRDIPFAPFHNMESIYIPYTSSQIPKRTKYPGSTSPGVSWTGYHKHGLEGSEGDSLIMISKVLQHISIILVKYPTQDEFVPTLLYPRCRTTEELLELCDKFNLDVRYL